MTPDSIGAFGEHKSADGWGNPCLAEPVGGKPRLHWPSDPEPAHYSDEVIEGIMYRSAGDLLRHDCG